MGTLQDETTGGEPPVGSHPREHVGEGVDPVARERGLLEPLLLGEGLHLRHEAAEQGPRLAERRAQVVHQAAVGLRGGPSVARSEATAHIRKRARSEASALAHRARAPADREGLLQRLLREARALRRPERPDVDRTVAGIGPAGNFQPGPGLGRVELQVREALPALAVRVVAGQVRRDQSDLDDERFELGRRLDRLDRGDGGDQILDLLPLVAVEIRLHASA